jgi:hypothetical protein
MNFIKGVIQSTFIVNPFFLKRVLNDSDYLILKKIKFTIKKYLF